MKLMINIFYCLLIVFVSNCYSMLGKTPHCTGTTPRQASTIQTNDLTQDSDPNRRHYLGKPRYWTWKTSLNFCINNFIPCEFRIDKLFSADQAHFVLADIERQFSFEVEEHRNTLREILIKQKIDAESEKLEIQVEQLNLERDIVKLKTELDDFSRTIPTIKAILEDAPKVRGHKTVTQFSEAQGRWINKKTGEIKQLDDIFELFKVVIPEGSNYIIEALQLKKKLEAEQPKKEMDLKEKKSQLNALLEQLHKLELTHNALKRQLDTVSATINVATVGISIVLKKKDSLNYNVLFSPLCTSTEKTPIVFSSSALCEMNSQFCIVQPQRKDFATALAKSFNIDQGPYKDTISSYAKLRDTEANAIQYLLTVPKGKTHKSILHESILHMLEGTDYDIADIESVNIHIHTKKDPCSLCTRLLEGFFFKLNTGEFIHPIRAKLRNTVLISSCDDYFGGKARSLFFETDTSDTKRDLTIYDLANLEGNYLFFKLI